MAARRRPARPAALAFTPVDALGQFVAAHYKPGLRQGAYERLVGQGGRVSGGRVSTATTRSRQATVRAADRRRLPEGWGPEGVVGGWGRQPSGYDANRWEFGTNSAGRVFARPLTETTGLDPADAARLRSFDAQTAAQQARIQAAYQGLATAAQGDAEAQGRRLTALTQAAGVTSATPQGPTWGGAGATIATQTDPASTALAATNAETARAISGIQSMLDTQAQGQWAAQARGMGVQADADYAAKRQGDRTGFLDAARTAAAKARAEAATLQAQQQQRDAQAERDRYNLSARLRGQNLQLLGTQLGIGGSNYRAVLGQQTAVYGQQQATARSTAATAATNARTQATLNQRERESIRRLQAQETTLRARLADAKASRDAALQRTIIQQQQANARAQAAIRSRAAQRTGGGSTALRQAQNDALRWAQGVPQTTTQQVGTDSQGRPILRNVTNTVAYTQPEIVRLLMSRGIPRAQAVKIARASGAPASAPRAGSAGLDITGTGTV